MKILLTFKLFVILSAMVVYFFPSMVADAKDRKEAPAITAINALLGWTVIGWFAAFVWARYGVSERRLAHVGRDGRREMARVTIAKIVARSRRIRFAAGRPSAVGGSRKRVVLR